MLEGQFFQDIFSSAPRLIGSFVNTAQGAFSTVGTGTNAASPVEPRFGGRGEAYGPRYDMPMNSRYDMPMNPRYDKPMNSRYDTPIISPGRGNEWGPTSFVRRNVMLKHLHESCCPYDFQGSMICCADCPPSDIHCLST
eukprot:GHVU01111147.1.p1 GENE.GHVU01111147.1~~GHVU01111147.1.p1  ORF type:complete len:139 (-),score=1.03 GHVU01111147.1:239-655(-)